MPLSIKDTVGLVNIITLVLKSETSKVTKQRLSTGAFELTRQSGVGRAAGNRQIYLNWQICGTLHRSDEGTF
uniref:Transposase n=1 Tax=Angiostrongylus cantonensis TaxID=6313 RepID=A0A0K0CUD8_ANGCA